MLVEASLVSMIHNTSFFVFFTGSRNRVVVAANWNLESSGTKMMRGPFVRQL